MIEEMHVLDLVKISVWSRLILIFLQATSNFLIPDHTSSMLDVSLTHERVPHPYLIDVIFRGLSSWDGEHYLLIAEQGYKYETNLAFFPLYPLLIRFLSHYILTPLGVIGLKTHSITLIAGVLINLIAFPISTCYLYQLSKMRYPNSSLIPTLTILLFTISPANIFMSAVYTECLFSLFSFACMYYLTVNSSGRASLFVALACGTRSNGITLCLFVAMHHLEAIVRENLLRTIIIKRGILCSFQILFGISPLILFQMYTAHKLNYKYTGLLPYSFLQQKHWGVGMFSYYELKQVPNFLLASPIIVLSILTLSDKAGVMYRLGVQKSRKWLRMIQESSYLMHLCFLLTVGIIFMHIQVLTRFILSSTPLLFWYAASQTQKYISTHRIEENQPLLWSMARLAMGYRAEQEQGINLIKARLIIIYFLGFSIAGIIMFPNFLPWTMIQESSYLMHLCFLLTVGIIFMHIQVLTRFILSSTPLLFWYAASQTQKYISTHRIEENQPLLWSMARLAMGYRAEQEQGINLIKGRLIIIYFLGFSIAGIIMFPNFLPWT